MSTALTRERADGPTDPLAGDVDAAADPAQRVSSRLTLPAALRAGAPVWIWAGIAVATLGFILIAVGWGQVAAETQVYLQLPYVVSAALVGLGLVMVGLAVVNIATRQRDGIDRDRQIAQLVTIMEELRETLQERDGP